MWCLTQFPCNAAAQDAEMSLVEYEDFILTAYGPGYPYSAPNRTSPGGYSWTIQGTGAYKLYGPHTVPWYPGYHEPGIVIHAPLSTTATMAPLPSSIPPASGAAPMGPTAPP